MQERATRDPQSTRQPADKRPAARSPAQPAAQALALQRQVGNRAAAQVLARWSKHPDEEQKGVVLDDLAAEEFNQFNWPKNE